jgi:lipoate-protein ligase A
VARLATRPDGCEGLLTVAPIVGDAFVLGAFQRVASTLDLARPEVRDGVLARRATGGVALHVQSAQVLVALDLVSSSVLGGNGDPARAINRHVRPLLKALTNLGVPATYGGRDFVLAGGTPVAFIGVTHDRALGTVGLEMVVAVDAPFGVDPALDLAHGSIAPRWLGRTPGTISARAHRAVSTEAVVEAIVAAWSEQAAGDMHERHPSPSITVLAPRDEPPFEALVEEGMGLLGAVVDAESIAIGGELMVSRDVLGPLGATLHALGPAALDGDAIERAIDAALGPTSGAMLFGVKSLASIAKVARAAMTKTFERPR